MLIDTQLLDIDIDIAKQKIDEIMKSLQTSYPSLIFTAEVTAERVSILDFKPAQKICNTTIFVSYDKLSNYDN